MQEPTQPRTLGNYNLLASLATGGMAKVYLALRAGPAGFNKLLVVKILRDDVPQCGEDGLSMFWDEARLAAQLVHPNIVHTYEVGENAGEYFLAMEYLDGQSYRNLAKRGARLGSLPLLEHLRILSESARGLHYAHQLKDFSGQPLGVVHRDVSPQNVFVTYDGQVKVLDFGIAKTHDAEHKTQVGVIKGKLDYMAPEQLRGDVLDGRADVFALGVMLWEAISGVSFAGGRQVAQVARLHARLAGKERKLQEVAPETPPALLEIVERSIALHPGQRYADAAAFADAVDAYIATLDVAPPSAKSLAAVIGPMFATERNAMHKLIEQQIALVKRGVSPDSTAALPRLAPGEPRSTSNQYLGEPEDLSRSEGAPAAALGMSGTAKLKQRPSPLALLAVSAAVAVGGALAWFSGADNERAAASPNKPQPSLLGSSATSSAAQDVASQPASAAAPHAGLPGSVSVEFQVSPPSAKVTLDGAALPLPFSGEFPRSAAVRRIEVTAPGFRPFSKLLAFDQDQRIEVTLEPVSPIALRRPRVTRNEREPAAPTQSAPALSAPSPAPQASVSPGEFAPGSALAPKPRVRRAEIDMNDPYAR